MLVGLRFGVPELLCLSAELLVKFSNETSSPSGYLTVILAAVRGTNVRESTSSRIAPDMEDVDGVGGDVKTRLFEECARAEGWGG